jgi:hypothetical protein
MHNAEDDVCRCRMCDVPVVTVKEGGVGYITVSPNPTFTPLGSVFADGGNLWTPEQPVKAYICTPCLGRGRDKGTFPNA